MQHALSSIPPTDDVFDRYEFTGIKFKNRMDSIIESIDPQKEAKQTAKVGDSSANSLGSDQDVISEHERSESLSSDSSGEITKPMKTAKRLDKELSKVILLLEDYPEVHRLAAQIENEVPKNYTN